MIAPPLSLYVHFPWCVRKCPYCDFNSHALRTELPESEYIQALENDLAAQAAEVQGRPVISVFLGGGTPSLFSPEAIGRFLSFARRHLDLPPTAEVTMEANPGTIERGVFTGYREAGVNRVSLGAQSFDARRLATLGRIHSPDETRRAAEELHAAGLANFNLDLMYALPGQDLAGAVADIEQALSLSPAHLSHYQLTIEPGTVFAASPPALPTDDAGVEMLAACQEHMARRGFSQYEVSAYARTERRCRHNLNYWTFGDYLGIGAGAHGKLTFPDTQTIVRTTQLREPRRYLSAPPGANKRSVVSDADLPFEFMLNALRLTHGFEIDTFAARTGLAWESLERSLRHLTSRGLIELQGRRCRPTTLGSRFLNDVLLTFMPENAGHRVLSTGI
jgi:putative oxygen-independent coproporphyrinogen III oxidase